MRTQASPGRVGWIFGSFSERDEALALLDDDGPAEPRDELGIGPLRDVFANAFFPGITSPQTRAKYFLFVPAMYKRIEEDTTLRRRPATAIAELEQALLEGLMGRGDLDGVIGSKYKRVPTTPASIDLLDGRAHVGHQTLLRQPHALSRVASDPISAPASRSDRGGRGRGAASLAVAPRGHAVLESPDIHLSRPEASFLEGRVHALPAQPGRPLLRQLLDTTLEPGPFWDSQLVRRNRADLSQEARDAERLSVAHNGAMRLYNLLCARQAGDAAAVEDWLAECEIWSAEHPPDEWREWNLTVFWDRITRLPGRTGGKGSY